MTTRVLTGDCRAVLATLPAESVQMVCTSPPYYGLRDYGVDGQIGMEPTPDAYVAQLVEVFRGVKRVLRNDGVVFLNLGDSYAANGTSGLGVKGASSTLGGGENTAHTPQKKTVPAGLKSKDLLGTPWRVAFALQADGWYLRSAIVWHKPNPMPESVTDRCTSAYEMVFMLAKAERYFYDAEAVREVCSETSHGGPSITPGEKNSALGKGHATNRLGKWDAENKASGRNARNVWTIATTPYPESHYAVMPPALAERCILAGSRPGDTVLDCFMGAGTTLLVADRLQRDAVGIELNPSYARLAADRITADAPLFAAVAD